VVEAKTARSGDSSAMVTPPRVLSRMLFIEHTLEQGLSFIR